MRYYYFNNRNRSLVVFDPESKELEVLLPIDGVKVKTGNEVQMGDFAGGGMLDEISNTAQKHTKIRYCKKCSKPGHRSDNCPENKS